eukprot:TRINITY_DN4394_c0_g1_i1.p1 TRINITY_DN4394_c0_g1~~TRINITY_DN4394_c0_g1_i1.p1  ORF type:complete len:469 (+),score=118.96 TRINITY_DN4394_c0_g1_i1:203-1408(+)
MEAHHSLHHPFDQSVVYWKYGGATVMTKSSIRLVPASQSRAGWLWNDYPLESEDWEVEVALKVQSKPHFGGDGFAFWVLSGEMDPSFHFEPDFLNGPMFGLKDDFKGFGVIFDTYDNDGKRDNPSVFVVQNEEGRFGVHDHDNDFEQVMLKTVPTSGMQYKCFSSYRNTKNPYRVLIRYRKKILHVYVQDGSWNTQPVDFKYCLSVQVNLPSSIGEKHIAFTALTGQVADKIDILEISTRYINEKDAFIDDAKLDHASGSPRSTFATIFWLVILAIGAGLAYWTSRDISALGMLKNAQTNPVYLANELNRTVVRHMALHFVVCGMLLFTGSWLGLILNSPLLVYRIYQAATNTYELDPAVLAGGGRSGKSKNPISFEVQLYITITIYVIACIYYLIRVIWQ